MAGYGHKALGQLLLRPPRYGINAAAVPLRPGVATYIRITDINDSGQFAPDPKVGVAHKGADNYRLATGELVFARTGASVGKSYLYDPADGDLVYAGFLINIAPDPKRLNPKYLSLFAQSKEYWDWIARTSIRSGQPGVNGREYAALPVPLPDIAEQDAIAAAMTDVDYLITALERLIAKKQAIKQGMMQQLLTGRTRLPGFNGPWSLRSIGDFAQVKAGGTPSTAVPRYWGGDIRWMSSGEVHQKRVREVRGRITVDGLRESSAQLLPVGTVLIALAGQGKTRGTVAVSRVELSTNQSIAGILPSKDHDSEFLYYNLDTRYDELRGESAGEGGRGGLNLTIIKSLEVFMPGIDEQAAIARVLAAVDDEVSGLSNRVDKARAIKQGMMQQLLTGRTRLPIPEAAA